MYNILPPSHETFEFWEISDNVLETVQDGDIVAVERLTGNHRRRSQYASYATGVAAVKVVRQGSVFCCIG